MCVLTARWQHRAVVVKAAVTNHHTLTTYILPLFSICILCKYNTEAQLQKQQQQQFVQARTSAAAFFLL